MKFSHLAMVHFTTYADREHVSEVMEMIGFSAIGFDTVLMSTGEVPARSRPTSFRLGSAVEQ